MTTLTSPVTFKIDYDQVQDYLELDGYQLIHDCNGWIYLDESDFENNYQLEFTYFDSREEALQDYLAIASSLL